MAPTWYEALCGVNSGWSDLQNGGDRGVNSRLNLSGMGRRDNEYDHFHEVVGVDLCNSSHSHEVFRFEETDEKS